MIARQFGSSKLLRAVKTKVRVALKQRSITQRRRVSIGIALKRVCIAMGGDNRVDLDDAAPPGECVAATANLVNHRSAGVGNLFGMVEPNRVAVVDPLQRHARNVCPQDLLGYGIPAHAAPAVEIIGGGKCYRDSRNIQWAVSQIYNIRWTAQSARRTPLQLLQNGVQTLLGVAEQHSRVVLEEQRILHACISGRHAALQHDRRVAFPDL